MTDAAEKPGSKKRAAATPKRAAAATSAGRKPASSRRKAAAPARVSSASVRETAAGAATSGFFRRATERARRISNEPEKLRELAEKAGRSSAQRTGAFAGVLDDFRALIRLVVAYARGFYRGIPIDKLIVVVAGLIYVVTPIDAIPDTIPLAGFLDDAAVIGWVIKAVRDELDAFREWEVGAED